MILFGAFLKNTEGKMPLIAVDVLVKQFWSPDEHSFPPPQLEYKGRKL